MSDSVDAPARIASVDPGGSVCVSAPAGSGKTELLIQRYLNLLSRVQRPEQVLAITFTRKAAAEMRERVMEALHSAKEELPCENPHQRATRALAERALAADARSEWQLLRNTSRFNIKTIDSFCAGLTRQMPVLSQFGAQANIKDDVTPLYTEAVQELYKLLEGEHPVADDLATLLLHFDNDWERLQSLLVSMLARREQWRDYVGVHHAPEEAEDFLVATVGLMVSNELDEVARLLSPFSSQLLELLQFAAMNLDQPAPAHFPGSRVEELAAWITLRDLLLTKKGDWRKKISKTEGFPSGTRGEPAERKQQWQQLLEQLRGIDGLQSRLAAIQSLPQIETRSASWQLVLHLSRLLPTLAAQLLLVFQKHGVVDHAQVAQSALLALGEDDTPTELALRLDYQIEHILVDEFQDTAITQYELLQKLTRGWGEYNEQNPDAPRTFMIVGDGMQSIYGFRGANVGLFLKARREGFNGVIPTYLELSCNFRSDKGVVDWVNHAFQKAFPATDDVYRSQIRYSPATAVRPERPGHAVEMRAFSGEDSRDQEVLFIAEQIANCVASTQETIAVLGRSRSHLQLVVKQLKHLGIPYNAPDLDSLSQSPAVADLLTLCRALSSDADRLAWFALLRAPWCGLDLRDLLCVARFGEAPPYTPVWSTLQHPDLQNALSEDGRDRLQAILGALHKAREKRDRLSVRAWLEQTWVELGGPGCVAGSDSLADVESFLQLLEQAETEGVGFDLDWLTQ
ncbi:MAG: UvrD-helicase domain-containing protein, partial [Halioglobus sp.]|nr:UvrD-helicase domain-containing protein [Halioglobus sp.]